MKNKNTKPEKSLKKELRKIGVKISSPPKGLVGRPDIWIDQSKIAIFVDGDFWHRCPVHSRIANKKGDDNLLWQGKWSGIVTRDREVERKLLSLGVLPIRIWECEINKIAPVIARQIKDISNGVVSRKLSLNRLAWAAGFIDGEGTVTLMAIVRGLCTSNICVSNVNLESINELKDIFGFGTVRSWCSKRRHIYKWNISGCHRTGIVLMLLKCMLIIKRPQAELVNIFNSTVHTKEVGRRRKLPKKVWDERSEILKAVRSLNMRGRDIDWRGRLSEAAGRAWFLINRGSPPRAIKTDYKEYE